MKSHIPSVVFIFLAILLSTCQDQFSTIRKDLISGQVQKGPFINGTSLLMSELSSSLEQTGSVFTAQISDDLGSFELSNLTLSSSYVEFAASGFYFDEVKGEISSAQLNLYALSDLEDKSSINVNILTHLEKRRVEYLVKDGLNFGDAKSQAQREILDFFGFDIQTIESSEVLDITHEGDGNAVLLAISIILQGNRSVGELTELMSKISTNLFEDGEANDSTIKINLRETLVYLKLSEIRSNLEQRYSALGLSVVIPEFETYINDFLSLTATAPIPVGLPATNITNSGATLNGTVNPNSSSTVVTFEYGLTTEYGSAVTALQSPLSGHTNTSVSVEVSDLNPGTTYHFRVKAENELGTIYSDDILFRTTSTGITGTVTDVDGNIYATIGIGDQTWMAENLKTTKYNDDTDIPLVTDGSEWDNLTTPGYCWYDNDQATYGDTYGALYNWYTVETGNLCPTGWHVPTEAEWTELTDYLGGESVAGGKLKETGTSHWESPNEGATNESGFTALPGGYRGGDGGFGGVGSHGRWWSATEGGTGGAWGRGVRYSGSNVGQHEDDEVSGYSVRCLRD